MATGTKTRLRYVDSGEQITRDELYGMTYQAISDNVSPEYAASLTKKQVWEETEDAIANRIEWGILERY